MSSNIIDLDAGFRKEEHNADIVKRLLPTIEHYRELGKTLKTIHKVLVAEGIVSMSFGAFRSCYYTQRKIKQSSNISALDSSKPYIPPASSKRKKSVKQSEAERKEDASIAENIRKIETDGESLEDYLAAHQAQARAFFED